MELSYELISQFAKQIVKSDTKTNSEATVYGTIKVVEDKTYVQLDGSEELTPIDADSTSANANDGERVSVLIKNHTATVNGNISSPAARNDDVVAIQKFGILVAEQVQADKAYFKKLIGDEATLGKLEAAEISVTELLAKSAEIDALLAGKITVTDLIAAKIDADVVIADKAIIESLKSTNADILSLIAEKAIIDKLVAEKANLHTLMSEEANIKFANIDFANIGEAAIRKIFSETGLIRDLVVGDQTITGELVGVTIKGDLIEGNTIKADKLVIKDSEKGLYYKLNFEAGNFASGEEVPTDSLHGSVITAKSITAEKVSVKDLVAFGATIGGFNITNRSLYSGVKSSIDNSTRGVYLDNEGQISLGDDNHFLRYYYNSHADAFISDDGVLTVVAKPNSGYAAMYYDPMPDIVEYRWLVVLAGGTDMGGAPPPDITIHDDVLLVEDSGSYKLEISADSIWFGADSKSSASDLKALTEHVKIGTIIDEETGDEKPCVELAEGDSDFKQVITNVKTMFMDGGVVKTEIDHDGIKTENIDVKGEFKQGGFIWASRENGNYGLSWKG